MYIWYEHSMCVRHTRIFGYVEGVLVVLWLNCWTTDRSERCSKSSHTMMFIFGQILLGKVSHLPPITITIQIRPTRHAGDCWRRRDELISGVLLWTPTYGQARAGWPARTYIQQLYEDTGCSPEELPEAINDREKWRERVSDISAGGMTWWWWWWLVF